MFETFSLREFSRETHFRNSTQIYEIDEHNVFLATTSNRQWFSWKNRNSSRFNVAMKDISTRDKQNNSNIFNSIFFSQRLQLLDDDREHKSFDHKIVKFVTSMSWNLSNFILSITSWLMKTWRTFLLLTFDLHVYTCFLKLIVFV